MNPYRLVVKLKPTTSTKTCSPTIVKLYKLNETEASKSLIYEGPFDKEILASKIPQKAIFPIHQSAKLLVGQVACDFQRILNFKSEAGNFFHARIRPILDADPIPDDNSKSSSRSSDRSKALALVCPSYDTICCSWPG